MPVIEHKSEGPDPREPFRLGTGGIDEEAEEVAEHGSEQSPTRRATVGSGNFRVFGKIDEREEKLCWTFQTSHNPARRNFNGVGKRQGESSV